MRATLLTSVVAAAFSHMCLAQEWEVGAAAGYGFYNNASVGNPVTGLSASGPAYIFMILESLAEGGVKMGLPRDIAMKLAGQTVMGSAKMMLETGDHPALLKDAVATPAGCTVDGILELEEGGLRVTLIKAVVKASQRAKELLFS